MKKLLIVLFIFIVLASMVVGAVYYVLNAAWITECIVPRVFNSMEVPDLVMEKFSLSKQRFSLDGTLGVEKLMCILRDSKERNGISIERITVSSVYPFLGVLQARNQIGIILYQGSIMGTYMRINGVDITANIFLKKRLVESIVGNVDITSASYEGWCFSDASARFQGTPDDIVVNDIHMDFYGGTITGYAHARPAEGGAYTVDLVLDDVDIARLATDKPEMFSQIEGIAQVVMEIEGRGEQLVNITAHANVSKNSKIDAALLGPLLQYVPQSTQRKELELIMKEKKKIPLDTTLFTVKNTDSETVAATIQLVSKNYNLDINLTVDFHVEGGIMNLFTLFQKQVKPDTTYKG